MPVTQLVRGTLQPHEINRNMISMIIPPSLLVVTISSSPMFEQHRMHEALLVIVRVKFRHLQRARLKVPNGDIDRDLRF
jgi:hypothetical protein